MRIKTPGGERVDTMPAAWAEYASRKIEAPDGGADNSWPESLIHDEHGIKLTISLLGWEIANGANGWTDKRKYQVLVLPDRLRELNTRRHKYLDSSFRREYGIADPRIQMIMNFRTGELCAAFLDRSRWSRLLMGDEAIGRIDEGKGTPKDIVTLSHRTALVGRRLDEKDPELIGILRREYHPEREFLLPDREHLKRIKKDLLSLGESIAEEQPGGRP